MTTPEQQQEDKRLKDILNRLFSSKQNNFATCSRITIEQSILQAIHPWKEILQLREANTAANLLLGNQADENDKIVNQLRVDINQYRKKCKLNEATETCIICNKQWNPSIVESRVCIFCIVKEKEETITKLHADIERKDVALNDIMLNKRVGLEVENQCRKALSPSQATETEKKD